MSWEILPPGTREEVLARVFRGRSPSPQEKAAIEERYEFLMGLSPKNLIAGTSGFQRYFGALVENDLVVFDNVEYGNAIYVMFADWKEVSRRTRTELLSGRYGKNFVRVLHTSGWKTRIKKAIQDSRKKNGS